MTPEKLGLHYTRKGKKATCETNLAGIFRIADNPDCYTWINPRNRTRITDDILSDKRDRIRFSGGTMAMLKSNLGGGIDLKPFSKAYAEFQKSGIKKDIATQLTDCNPRRMRKFSEHDGEWSYDRRYEIEPFSRTYRKMTPGRTLTIIADFSINCNAKPEEIDQYGALLWAVSQLVESCGIQTCIVWQGNTESLDEECSLDLCLEIEVKKPGQYLAPTLLAAVFSSLFFRRMGFAAMVLTADHYNRTASYGLGTPIARSKAAEFKAGRLHLSPKVSSGYSEELKTELIKAIRGEE